MFSSMIWRHVNGLFAILHFYGGATLLTCNVGCIEKNLLLKSLFLLVNLRIEITLLPSMSAIVSIKKNIKRLSQINIKVLAVSKQHPFKHRNETLTKFLGGMISSKFYIVSFWLLTSFHCLSRSLILSKWILNFVRIKGKMMSHFVCHTLNLFRCQISVSIRIYFITKQFLFESLDRNKHWGG